ncbi:MAG TPA: hypothetical protein VKG91_19325 [Roseiarcus sp.]|nr:hypothetical protein [Roseiarcus sp.]
MAWIFEPQRNIADEGDTETMHVPCSLADATIVAVFEGDAGELNRNTLATFRRTPSGRYWPARRPNDVLTEGVTFRGRRLSRNAESAPH